MSSRKALLATITLVLSAAASAQQPRFEDSVIVTAVGEQQDASDTTAAATVIDRDEIEALGVAAVADLLRLVPGVTLLRSGLDNNVASLFVRGTASTQTLVLFDGVRLNSPFFGGYDWSLPLTIGIERIEVVRGPFSSLYGGDAVGGVVQIVPRRDRDSGARALLEGGGNGWRRGEVEAALAGQRWSLLVAGASREGTGELENDDFRTTAGMVDVGFRLGENGRIGVLARRTESATEIPFDGSRPTPRRHTEANETLVAVPIHLELGRTIEVDGAVSHIGRDLTFRDPDDPWGFTASDTAAETLSGTTTVRATLGGHRLSAGGEWRRDQVTDTSSYGTNLLGQHLTTRALFLQDAASFGHGVSLVAGVRWDEANPWGSELSPRLTLGWASGSLRTWVAYGQAFRAPGLGDLYYPYFGNPELVPEHSRSLETGVRFPVGRGTTLELIGFRNRIDDLIDFDFVTQRSANIAQALQDGFELSWTSVVGRGHASGMVTWLDARDGSGAQLRRRPEWSSSISLYGPLRNMVNGAFEVAWIGERPDLDPLTYDTVRAAGFVTVSGSIAVALSPSLTARLRVENLADRRYEAVTGYPAPGRRLLVGLETVLR